MEKAILEKPGVHVVILSMRALEFRRLILGGAAEGITTVVGWTYWCRGQQDRLRNKPRKWAETEECLYLTRWEG